MTDSSEFCYWCGTPTPVTKLRSVQAEPDRRANGALVAGLHIRVGPCCATIVSRQLSKATEARDERKAAKS